MRYLFNRLQDHREAPGNAREFALACLGPDAGADGVKPDGTHTCSGLIMTGFADVVSIVHGFCVSGGIAGVNHCDDRPPVAGVSHIHRACTARFTGSMPGGAARLACG